MTEPTSITNTEDLIDSRDVIARIEYLRDQARAAFESENPHAADCSLVDEDYGSAGPSAWLDEDEGQELRALEALADEADGYGDWSYGETLIRDSYFEDYARDLAEGVSAVDPNASWPLTYIDWERAAEALLVDYTSYEFDGVTYWGRS